MEAELHRAEAWKPTQFGVPDDLLAGVKRWPPADVAPAPVVKPASAHKGECVLRDLHGRKMRVLEMSNVSVPFRMAIHPPSVDPMARDMVRDGFWEIHNPADLAKPVAAWRSADVLLSSARRRTLVDIGANLGYYSLLFASHGWNVLAVEPMAYNRNALAASLCLNPTLASRITLVAAALVSPDQESDHCVVVSPGRNAGNGRVICNRANCSKVGRGFAHCEPIRTTTLDRLLSETALTAAASAPDDVVVAKMDVEGFECNVLKGGLSLFYRLHPRFFQVELKRPHVRKCVEEYAKAHGFVLGPSDGHDGNTVLYPAVDHGYGDSVSDPFRKRDRKLW